MKYKTEHVVRLVCDALKLLEARKGMYAQQELAGVLGVVTDAVREGKALTAEQVLKLARPVAPLAGTGTAHRSIEICAGGGGQALGLEQAGFSHVAVIEIDTGACKTLRHNRPHWPLFEGDIKHFSARPYYGVELLAGGVPCPPFSVAGKQLGEQDERDLFPEALRLVRECNPKAVMLENVRGILDKRFDAYRARIVRAFEEMGYTTDWQLLHASDFGVPQLRPRALLVALKEEYYPYFEWPRKNGTAAPTVGDVLFGEMSKLGWRGAEAWRDRADRIAPTLVGGSKKHGGPDLGPTRARKAWAELGIDGLGLANAPPEATFQGMPRLTITMAATLQGFPSTWAFVGSKTQAYRQVGNAFPPPVAQAVGRALIMALEQETKHEHKSSRVARKTA